ncbi:MAG: hypothetical protein ABL932_14340 [Terricaulis sp.]
MFAGIIGVAGALITISGALTTTSGTSPVTSATRTISGAGSLRFDSVTTFGGTPQYSKNAAAYADITEGLTLTVATSDTIAVRAVLGTPALTATFTIRNHASGAKIEDVVLTRS